MNRAGFTIIGLMVSLGLGVVIIAAGGSVSKALFKTSFEHAVRERVDSSLAETGHFIKAIGRTATACLRQGSALVCTLNAWTTHNQTNQPVQVQFIVLANRLNFQREIAPNTNNWNTEMTTPEIIGLTLCDATDMRQIPTAPTFCSIVPNDLSLAFAAQGLGAPNNFLRFQLIAEGQFADTRRFRKEYQSSFSVRNGGALVYE